MFTEGVVKIIRWHAYANGGDSDANFAQTNGLVSKLARNSIENMM